MGMTEHAVVIAGGGPAGMMLAAELALAKIDVAVVERRADRDLVGQTGELLVTAANGGDRGRAGRGWRGAAIERAAGGVARARASLITCTSEPGTSSESSSRNMSLMERRQPQTSTFSGSRFSAGGGR